jgi:hypothetical protein
MRIARPQRRDDPTIRANGPAADTAATTSPVSSTMGAELQRNPTACPSSSTEKPATRALEVGPQHLPAFHSGEIHRLTFVLDRKIDGLSAVFHQAPQCGAARQTRLRVLVNVQPVTNAWTPIGRCKRVVGDGFRSQGPPPTG